MEMLEEPQQDVQVSLLCPLQPYRRVPLSYERAQPRPWPLGQLSSTQNILTEALSSSTPELNVALPKLESLARVAQRARAKPSVQEYFRAIRDQQVTTDYHIDRLAAGMTPAKKRKTSNHILYKICEDFLEYDSVLSYMFKVAEYFGHEL